MAECTIEPTPLVWMGEYGDLPEHPLGWPVGWAFFGFGYYLSEHYKANVAHIRPPITIACPCERRWDDGRVEMGATSFCIDSFPTGDPTSHWDVIVDLDSLVIGQKPLITVHPSIWLHDIWHGWCQEGILHN